MLDGEFFRFQDGSLVAESGTFTDVRLAAADSFLVENGMVRSLGEHHRRFAKWVSNASPMLDAKLPAFFEAVISAIPKTGRWFPRIELHLANPLEAIQRDSLYLRLRKAPDQLGDIVLWTLDEPDPRLNPQIKGPDLSLCMQLRRKAQLHGADEAVLLDLDGYISEGALSSLVWWRGDTLCAPDSRTHWLESITRTEVLSIAASIGISVRLERSKPADLVGLEVWALSSLQGIRPVREWVGLGSPVGPVAHLEQFQKRLRLYSQSLG